MPAEKSPVNESRCTQKRDLLIDAPASSAPPVPAGALCGAAGGEEKGAGGVDEVGKGERERGERERERERDSTKSEKVRERGVVGAGGMVREGQGEKVDEVGKGDREALGGGRERGRGRGRGRERSTKSGKVSPLRADGAQSADTVRARSQI